MSPASWKGALMAHLNRYKRFPPGAAGAGVATVAFTIDRSGAVRAARLVRSSGDRVLDAEAVSLPRRASPVPAPPPNVGGNSISLAVPIRFNR
jgi:protein TonB